MEKGNCEEIFKANPHTSVYKILMAINVLTIYNYK